MSHRLTKLFLAAAICLAMTACGWHLRGAEGNIVAFERLHISTADPHSDLVQQLKRQLEASDVSVVANATEAQYSLVIVKEDSQRRTATVSARARVSERSLTEWVEYLVLDSRGHPVVPKTKINVERIFEYNEDNVLATNDEALMLQREMRADLARQIVNQLRRLKRPGAGDNAAQS